MRYKILLVDDEAIVREELGELLHEDGYQVITAPNGADALTKFNEETPDMVITDVRMPQMDGITLAKRLLNDQPSLPITIITGHGSEQMVIEALRAGVSDFIPKPVKIEDLLAALRRMVNALIASKQAAKVGFEEPRLREKHWIFQLGNSVEQIPPFVNQVLYETLPDNHSQRSHLEVALNELLLNAIEHGNLAISMEEKSDAMENQCFDQLVNKRSSHPPYKNRTVSLEIKRTPEKYQIKVVDQGKGFNWRNLPDPTSPDNFLKESGRGVLLARTAMDTLTYSEKGNEVLATKYLTEDS